MKNKEKKKVNKLLSNQQTNLSSQLGVGWVEICIVQSQKKYYT